MDYSQRNIKTEHIEKFEEHPGVCGVNISSVTDTKRVIIFSDEYPDGKIITDDIHITKYEYIYDRDKNGNVTRCIIYKKRSKNGRLVDQDRTISIYLYDKDGLLIQIADQTDEGIVYHRRTYEYDDNKQVSKIIDKTNSNIRTTTYNTNKDVVSIIDKTIQSKAKHNAYKAEYDADNNPVYIHDGDRSLDIVYQRSIDEDGKVIQETKRFYDASSSTKKMILYITTTYIPISGYKIGDIIENGVLRERHTYNAKGEEIEMFVIEDNKEVFTRTEKTELDTTNVVKTTKRVIDLDTGDITETTVTKSTYTKDNSKLLKVEINDDIISYYYYDNDDRRQQVTTKKLINEDWKTIQDIHYTYSENTVTKELIAYNENGEESYKAISEVIDTELLKSNVHESFEYIV